MTQHDTRIRIPAASIVLVFVGGALGTLARYLLSLAIPAPHALPAPTLVVNVTGAFLLGALLTVLARRGPDAGARRGLRLLLGTGFLGGFTTYSAFAVDADGLIASADAGAAALYAGATLLVGAAATLAGMALGSLVPRPDPGAREDP